MAAGAAQVVTYAPSNPAWSAGLYGGGTGLPPWITAGGIGGWLVIGAAQAALIGTGDQFRLYTGASLKEPTLFTVTGLDSPAFGFVNVFFGPSPAVVPASGDTATAYPFPVLSQPRWLGTLGQVSGLKYSFTCPGGCDQMTCTLAVPERFRTDALNPGRMVRVLKGASVVWDGKLDEPVPGPGGWTVTAHGSGAFGSDFAAVYTGTWGPGTPDSAVNAAIARGLRWVNPGIGNPSGMWVGQPVDSGAQTITDLLNLVCAKGGLTWYVTCRPQGNILSVFPLPATPTRLLVSSVPVPRTLGGDINTVWLRYCSDADKNVPAVFATTSATEPASIAAHGPMETFADLSSAGVMTAGAAQAVGAQVLKRYQRASFAGPFQVAYGDLLTMGGQPVDLGCEQAGMVCKLILADYGYGGEITPAPVSFLVGAYEYDDDSQTAQVTPFQSVRSNFAGLLSLAVAAVPAHPNRR